MRRLAHTCRSLGLSVIATGVALAAAGCDRPNGPTAPAEGPAAAGAASAAVSAAATSVSHFYIHAHEDDWQLFMGEQVDSSVRLGVTVVLVYATAGDAGNPDPRYYQTREAAAQASVDAITPAGTWSCAARTIGTHPVKRCAKSSAPVVSYFLRMPDGNNTTGLGYGRGSLSALRDGGGAVGAIDGSTTYASWSDFTATVRGIVDVEANGASAPDVQVNAPEFDRLLNGYDHPDHFATADAVRAARVSRVWNLRWFTDYDNEGRPINLTAEQHAVKQKVFMAYDDVMRLAGYESYANDSRYAAWLERTYFRTDFVSVPPSALVASVKSGKSTRTVSLAWTRGTAALVDVRRNGATIAASVANGGSYSDVISKQASNLTYQVCLPNTTQSTNCTNTVTVR